LPLGYSNFNELATAAMYDPAGGANNAGAMVPKGGAGGGKLGYDSRGLLNPLRLFASTTPRYPSAAFGWRDDGDRGLPTDRNREFTGGVYSQGPIQTPPDANNTLGARTFAQR